MPVQRSAFSAQEFGQALGKSRQWVCQRIADNTIRSVKIEGARLIPATELDRLLDVADSVERSRVAQGFGPTVSDPAALAKVAALITAGGDAA